MRRFLVACLALSGVLVVVGCSSSSSDDAPKGRGSDACRQWQSAVCGWGSRCELSAEMMNNCKKQAPGTTCKSDELASSCAASLKSNACTTPPTGCDIRDLADPAPAVEACNQYTDAFCTSVERCGGGTKADCLADPDVAALCTDAIAYTLGFESCIAQLKTVSCTATALPEVCDGVILK